VARKEKGSPRYQKKLYSRTQISLSNAQSRAILPATRLQHRFLKGELISLLTRFTALFPKIGESLPRVPDVLSLSGPTCAISDSTSARYCSSPPQGTARNGGAQRSRARGQQRRYRQFLSSAAVPFVSNYDSSRGVEMLGAFATHV
jgi:hypothetical protein